MGPGLPGGVTDLKLGQSSFPLWQGRASRSSETDRRWGKLFAGEEISRGYLDAWARRIPKRPTRIRSIARKRIPRGLRVGMVSSGMGPDPTCGVGVAVGGPEVAVDVAVGTGVEVTVEVGVGPAACLERPASPVVSCCPVTKNNNPLPVIQGFVRGGIEGGNPSAQAADRLHCGYCLQTNR